MDSRLYLSGRLDWGSGKIYTNSSLQETSLGLVMSPAALLGSPDRIIGLQDALRGSCLLRFQLFTFIRIISSCSVNFFTSSMQYPSLAHLRNMEEVCVLLVALTNHRSARLTVALIRYRSARKYPFLL